MKFPYASHQLLKILPRQIRHCDRAIVSRSPALMRASKDPRTERTRAVNGIDLMKHIPAYYASTLRARLLPAVVFLPPILISRPPRATLCLQTRKKSMLKHIAALLLCLTVLIPAGKVLAADNPNWPQKWNYIHVAFENDQDVDHLIDLLKQSKDAGCTHIALGVTGYGRVDLLTDPKYIAKARRKIRAVADELKLELVPRSTPSATAGKRFGMMAISWQACLCRTRNL